MRMEYPQTRGQTLRSEVGVLAFPGEQKKTAVLNHKLLSLGTHSVVPADILIPVFERITTRPPGQETDQIAVHEYSLPEVIPCLTTRSKIMMFVQQAVEFLRIMVGMNDNGWL